MIQRDLPAKLLRALLELVFPSNIYCISCGEPIFEGELYALCQSCMEKIIWANQRSCRKCGKILQDWYQPELCMDCSYIGHSFTQGFCCVQYGEQERQLIHQLKYNGKGYIGRKMAEIMKDRIALEDLDIQVVIPVPIHRLKLRERGYNQAGLIARHLAAEMKLPYSEKLLIRIRETEPMNQLKPRDRRRNMAGAFAAGSHAKEAVADKSILLIDDIFTTGSTVDACSDVLLSLGARAVYVLVLAAGANEKQTINRV
jgi:ComF family protein